MPFPAKPAVAEVAAQNQAVVYGLLFRTVADCHTFRASGITAYLLSGGTLEWIGLNREPVARLWVLHGREGGAGVRPSRSCVGVAVVSRSADPTRAPTGETGRQQQPERQQPGQRQETTATKADPASNAAGDSLGCSLIDRHPLAPVAAQPFSRHATAVTSPFRAASAASPAPVYRLDTPHPGTAGSRRSARRHPGGTG